MTIIMLGQMAVAAVAAPPVAATPPPFSPAAKQKAQALNRLPPVYPHGWRRIRIDHSGRNERGRASFYARYFDNRMMANGHRFNPNTNIAASRTLPLGTTATVINLVNGRTAMVKVEDRGPFVAGRVVDVTPKVAKELHFTRRGVVPVVVKPITLPQPSGGVKLGAGAANASPQEIARATATTEALVDSGTMVTASGR